MSNCCCSGNSTENNVNIYSCSGASNTGLISDRVARTISGLGYGKISCAVAVATSLEIYLNKAKNSSKNIIIDGCNTACVAKIFNNYNINYHHIVITDYGVTKNKTLVTDELIKDITNKVINSLQKLR